MTLAAPSTVSSKEAFDAYNRGSIVMCVKKESETLFYIHKVCNLRKFTKTRVSVISLHKACFTPKPPSIENKSPLIKKEVVVCNTSPLNEGLRQQIYGLTKCRCTDRLQLECRFAKVIRKIP